MLRRTRLGPVVVLWLAPLIWGCSHDYSALEGTSGSGCPVGNETCACYPNSTCNDGLTCASLRCVRVGATGTGGTLGSGGALGSGGILGTGGNAATGGSDGTPGKGGTSGTGGTVGTGGATSTGGATGAGGGPGTGGATGTGGLGPPSNNQLVNGDFNSGTSAPWHVTVSTDYTSSVTNGQFCVTEPTAYTTFNIGWPATSADPAAVFQASTTYELYYQMSSTAPLYSNFSVKVGSAPSSNANLTYLMTTGNQGEPTAGAGLQTFAFTFVPGAAPAAGVVFLLTSGASATTVCIDNVALGTPN